jgi:uncharacterized protein (DUF1810 family)
MTPTSSNSQLQRFFDAQSNGDPAPLSVAINELEAGKKQTHWIWYVFPQLRGLGLSSHAEFYGIADKEEAIAYLQDPLLAERYRVCLEAIITHLRQGQRLEAILGPVDALKTISSVTLFRHLLQAEPALTQTGPATFLPLMDDFFELLSRDGNQPCERTLHALR